MVFDCKAYNLIERDLCLHFFLYLLVKGGGTDVCVNFESPKPIELRCILMFATSHQF